MNCPILQRTYNQGFSLIEMAIVLMILGTLLSGVLMAVGQSTENARRTRALVQLRQVEEALYGYAQSMGRLPCPATAATAGREAPITLPAAGGVCTAAHGFVPATTLGLFGAVNADGLLLDPWSNPLRYSVSTKAVGANRAFTSTLGLRALYAAVSTELAVGGGTLLSVCDNSTCSGLTLADTVPAVLISMGANWAAFTHANELANASGANLVNGGNTYSVTNTNTFVSTNYSEENFDDQLVWLSPHVLFNRLISAGKLP
jgi:prepilin-type N-terminal cleavage/methylation domain-containing protein